MKLNEKRSLKNEYDFCTFDPQIQTAKKKST